MLTTAPAKTSRGGSTVDRQCPFCGGPVQLADDEIIAACGNCGSMLRLLPPAQLQSFVINANFPQREALFFLNRELKQNKRPLVKRRGETCLLHLPFYFIKGKIFHYNKQVNERKFVNVTSTGEGSAMVTEHVTPVESQKALIKKWDMSVAAFDNYRFGLDSLGVRTSVLKLAPLSPSRAKDKIFLGADRDVSYALERYDKSVNRNSLVSGNKSLARFTRALYPQVNMVYLPVWLVNYQSNEGSFFAIIDSVAKRVVAIREGQMSQESLMRNTENLASAYKMVKHRCEYCGFDLPKQKTGELFCCSNCGRAWQANGDSYRQITINLPRISFEREARMFPFWMFELSTSGDNDFLKRALKLESDTLFIPAFELRNLKRAARVALSYSHKIDRIDFDKLEENSYPLQAATLNRREAERLILPLLLAGRDHIEHLDLEALFRLHLQFDNVIPVWLPFVEENYFYVGQMIGLGFEKSAVD